MPTTELVILTVAEGNEKIGDPSNKGAKALGEITQTLLATPGCRRVHFGNAIEDAQTVRLVIEWDSLGKHEEFMASSRYQSFLGNIKPIVKGPPIKYHVDFDTQEGLDAALAASTTELVAFYFDGEAPSDYGQGIEKAKEAFKTVKGYRGLAWGLTHEAALEHNGVKGRAAVWAIGWDSVDDHMAVRETQLFKDHVGLLRNGSKAALMQHIQALQAHKD